MWRNGVSHGGPDGGFSGGAHTSDMVAETDSLAGDQSCSFDVGGVPVGPRRKVGKSLPRTKNFWSFNWNFDVGGVPVGPRRKVGKRLSRTKNFWSFNWNLRRVCSAAI